MIFLKKNIAKFPATADAYGNPEANLDIILLISAIDSPAQQTNPAGTLH